MKTDEKPTICLTVRQIAHLITAFKNQNQPSEFYKTGTGQSLNAINETFAKSISDGERKFTLPINDDLENFVKRNMEKTTDKKFKRKLKILRTKIKNEKILRK